jgi:hypothetical protein
MDHVLLPIGSFVNLPNNRIGRLSWIDDEHVAYVISGNDVGVFYDNNLNFCGKTYKEFILQEIINHD